MPPISPSVHYQGLVASKIYQITSAKEPLPPPGQLLGPSEAAVAKEAVWETLASAAPAAAAPAASAEGRPSQAVTALACEPVSATPEPAPAGPAGQAAAPVAAAPVAAAASLAQAAQSASGSGSGPARIGEEEGTASARHLAYLQRKERIQARRQRQGSTNREMFLSGLVEVEADIRYRFNFVLSGEAAERITDAVCKSRAAQSLLSQTGHEEQALASVVTSFDTLPPLVMDEPGEGGAESPGGMSGSAVLSGSATSPQGGSSPSWRQLNSPGLRGQGVADRCLCSVVLSQDGTRQLAKLVFHRSLTGEDIPQCTSRAEALATVMVFTLSVGAPLEGQGSFEEQLRRLRVLVDRMRSRGKAKLRPVRAVVLIQSQSEAEARSDQGEQWAAGLADFEYAHGELWKFGPLSLQDGDSLHSTFAEMASARIAKYDAGGSPSSAGPREPEDEEEDGDGDHDEFVGRSSEEDDLRIRRPRSPSDASEGWQPPVFEAEFDGSECSEAALELHTRLFGLGEQGSLDTLACLDPLVQLSSGKHRAEG